MVMKNGTAQPREEYLFKILIIGDVNVGKTAIVKRYVHNFFSQHYKATIGVDFALKVISIGPNVTIRLQLWDIAGQERLGSMTRVYYKEASGAFIVFDFTRPESFEGVTRWKADLDEKVQTKGGRNIPAVLLANKTDLKEVTKEDSRDLDEFCTRNGFSGWFGTSAKEGTGVNEAAEYLIQQIRLNGNSADYEVPVQDRNPLNGIVALDKPNPPSTKSKCCFSLGS